MARGRIIGVTSPHADGEIWSATNYDIRQLLMKKVDRRFSSRPGAELQRRCADGNKIVKLCPGNRLWAQIYHDAFLLLPSSISFLDARDAFLAADRMRHQDANGGLGLYVPGPLLVLFCDVVKAARQKPNADG